MLIKRGMPPDQRWTSQSAGRVNICPACPRLATASRCRTYADVSRLAELGREGVLLLCGDSTNVDREGFSPSESVVGPHLEEVFARCEGRIVVTSFASNIHRVQQVVDAAHALHRKVALVGRSMRKNVGIGRSLGHIEVPEGLLVGPREINDFPDEPCYTVLINGDEVMHFDDWAWIWTRPEFPKTERRHDHVA